MSPDSEKTDIRSRDADATSRTLLARLRTDDSQAWDRLVSLYAPIVYFWCQRKQVPDQDVPDVVQEVFKSVSNSLSGFRKESPSDTFRGWLRIIARNKIADYYRRQQGRPRAAGGTAAQLRLSHVAAETRGEDDDEYFESEVFLRATEIVRRDFQESTFRAFWGTVVEGKAPKDVAEELAMSPSAVRVAKSRVLRRLREELGEFLS